MSNLILVINLIVLAFVFVIIGLIEINSAESDGQLIDPLDYPGFEKYRYSAKKTLDDSYDDSDSNGDLEVNTELENVNAESNNGTVRSVSIHGKSSSDSSHIVIAMLLQCLPLWSPACFNSLLEVK